MAALKLTLACRDYDHTRGLMDGTVPVDGVELKYLPLSPPSQIFLRMLRNTEFDACEMSLSNYLIALDRGDQRFVGIPVFPSRVFRHSNIWINAKSGIEEPRDLVGKRVGIPDYSMTALLFVRGMFQHQYGVSPQDLHWFRSRSEHISIKIPSGIRIENIGKDQTLEGMLEEGKLDAMVATSLPPSVRNGSPAIKRLFPSVRDSEAEYFRQTKIFPIMHLVILKRVIYRENRWVAKSLCNAFQTAKEAAYERYSESLYPLPWINADFEFARQIMGDDVFPYGIRQNLPTLQAAFQYSYEQGLTERKLELSEIFVAETFDSP
ncbi:MAG TPA: ABC transporter substrate-binding protein [Candidatus Binatia bacterium]|nr:ABC transporter substrate-binding protein [Candidatus Binatia bacterium]